MTGWYCERCDQDHEDRALYEAHKIKCPLCRDPHGARHRSARHTWVQGCLLFDKLLSQTADWITDPELTADEKLLRFEEMRPVETTGPQCAGCGKPRPTGLPAGWRGTDANWCPDCAWLA